MSQARHHIPLALLCAAATGCLSVPEFDEASIVDRPRVLAIVAEPPEVAPGESVQLSALLAAPEGESILDYEVKWSVCAAFFTQIRGSQYGEEPQEQGCGPDAPAFGDGPQASLPGSETARLFASLELATQAFGSLLPEDTVDAIRTRVGLPLLVEASIVTEGRVVRAVKRILVNGSGAGHHNPPPPHFDFDDIEIVPDDSALFGCRTADRAPLRWPANTRVELAPRVLGSDDDPDLEFWVEDYAILNARGEVETRREKPFYSWFSTGGSFDQEVTEAPLRNEVWRTPKRSGPTTLWVVVRDGHGGASGCGVPLEITK